MLSKRELARINNEIGGQIPRLAGIFNALSEANRCKIFRIFLKERHKPLSVSDIAQILQVTPASASQHLKILELTGLLQKQRQGQKVYYRVKESDPLIKVIIKAVLA